MQIVALEEPQHLTDLVRLGRAGDILEIDQVRDIRVRKDVMAAEDAHQLEPAGLVPAGTEPPVTPEVSSQQGDSM